MFQGLCPQTPASRGGRLIGVTPPPPVRSSYSHAPGNACQLVYVSEIRMNFTASEIHRAPSVV